MTRDERRAARREARGYIPDVLGWPSSAVDVAGFALAGLMRGHAKRQNNWRTSEATARLWLEWIADTTTQLEWQGRLAYTADCLSSRRLGKPPSE
uniref:Uncharacterized protein n=1 Tax=uncultured Armatimonadetes bacterium TaxID=157466 RepID=A0A6J4HM07_9BACT|nr:hypothetical protein AVDCRST_MAG63-832 [uncultured Armatimonadetes bacterium]